MQALRRAMTRRCIAWRPALSAPAPTVAPSNQSVADFYRLRKEAPLWFSPTAADSAEQLIALLSTASLDGLDPDKYHVAALQPVLEQARSGKRKDIAKADQQLS